MRTSDWIVRAIIAVLIGLFIYFLYHAYQQYQNVNHQQPNRPSVSETMNQLDNGKQATLDEEDYDEDDNDYDAEAYGRDGATGLSADKAISTVKDGVMATGAGIAAAGAAAKEKASKYIPKDPSINDLVALKEEEARKMEEGTTSVQTVNTPSSYNADGEYLVVAGSFRQMINAEKELRKLKDMGYDNASIGKFNNSTYASLIVDRFHSSEEAQSYVRKVKKKGLTAYVHKKR